jgi:hypothetical protein
MADFGSFPLEEKVSQLWQSLPGDPENDYPDEALVREFGILSPDQGFLLVVCWGPQRPARQKEIWLKVRTKFESFDAELHKLDAKQLEAVVGCYPFGRGKNGWQGKFVRNAHRFLRVNALSMSDLQGRLKSEDPFVARAILQDLFETSQTKIIDCYMRDILHLDAFPIDSRVKKVLANFSIPADPWALVAVCRKLNIPVRVFARAVYAMPDATKKKAKS